MLYLITKIVHLLPSTRCWAIKRFLYRLCGVCIQPGVKICSNVTIIGNANIKIGANTWIGHKTLILASDSINIGANVNIAPKVYIGTGTHLIEPNGESIAGKGLSRPISIGDGAWICAGSILVAGVSIGRKSIVAAGAVVIQDIPDNQLWGGVPAKFIRQLS